MAERKIVILGAGLGGLSAGWVLSRRGYSVTILEKSADVGGLAITKTRDGYEYDLGPHNIHTRHHHVLDFIKRTFRSLFHHTPTFKVHKDGVFVPYPLQGLKVVTSLPPWKIPLSVLSFLRARGRMFIGDLKDDSSFGAWIRNRFGSVLYREYFHDYPAKVWGILPDEIDKLVGEKRIPVLGITEMVRSILLGKKPRTDHPEVSEENYYLEHGIGEMAEFFREGLCKAGGEILCNTAPVSLIENEKKISGVRFCGGSGKFEEASCDAVLSTIPIPDFIALFGNPPENVKNSANMLDYCSSILLFLECARTNPLPATMVYFSEPDILFSRVSDMGAFSAKMVPPGKTLLCLEFPCSAGDGTWNRSVEELTIHARKVLEEKGLLRSGEIEKSFIERVAHSYPRFRKGYQDHLSVLMRFLSDFSNVVSFGRQGGFSYINTDSVMHQGFHAAAAVIVAESAGFSMFEWFRSATR